MRIQSTRQALYLVSLLSALPLAAAAVAEPEPAADDGARRVVREGIAIDFAIDPVAGETAAGDGLREGETVTFRFRITDTHTRTPLSGVYPAAWMDLRPEGEESGPGACQDKVEAFIGGSLFAPPELDLNVYYVLALNNDATISVVDPLFGFGTTKLLDMIFLDSPGEDWALSTDQMTLYVSLPEVNRVAVASTATWEVESSLDVGFQPSRLALQGDGRYLWVGFDGPRDGLSGVNVIDTEGPDGRTPDGRTPAVVKTILTGRGHHEIALSDGDRHAFVTNRGDGTVSVIDVGRLEKVRDVAVGREPVSLAYSPAAGAIYVASRADGRVTAIDAETHEVVATAEAEPGVAQIRFAPGGQLAFVANPERDVVYILDAALGRIVQTIDVEDGPDQVAFSDHLAYVRHQGSETVLMIPLDQVGREGSPVPVIDFPGGQRPFGQVSNPSPADGIVQAPGATAVLVANPADKTIYFYKEGMAAPMGHFQNYNRHPRAVLAVDRSLEERSPGVYETTATLRRPGLYDVAFFLDSPRTIHCFEVEVGPDPELQVERARRRPVQVHPLHDDRRLAAGEKIALEVGEKLSLRFELVDPVTQERRSGLRDVRVLTFRAPGRDQRRQPARQVGDGVYQVDFVPPKAGVYYAFVECDSLGLRYNESRQLILVAKGRPRQPSAGRAGEAGAES
jgi:YVTN family beta-propeller protein